MDHWICLNNAINPKNIQKKVTILNVTRHEWHNDLWMGERSLGMAIEGDPSMIYLKLPVHKLWVTTRLQSQENPWWFSKKITYCMFPSMSHIIPIYIPYIPQASPSLPSLFAPHLKARWPALGAPRSPGWAADSPGFWPKKKARRSTGEVDEP